MSSIEQSLYNRIYESNTQTANFYDLPFDGDERLITIWRIYCINDDTICMLNNGSSAYVYKNKI